MKVVIQRSLESAVLVEDEIISRIDKGLVLLVCLEKGDDDKTIEKAASKILNLRCFEDKVSQKMNVNIIDSGGAILAISQFTLSWNGQKGNRPGFDNSMPPDQAHVFFEKFCNILSQKVEIQTGKFGAHMKVQIINDGPVTFHLVF
ncbi:MAG: D-aminoacyl-tRNA deacylase [Bdellovibrionales bacterium]|jgi:D-tyrosyl-tRNA(Tyr) deacylase|nr:D-aminoacyl-tRNA deacylase [Bdellovibrionales bacterium]